MGATKPSVMCFSGLDPTGGAGIQADIETLFSPGCHCAPIITALTVQNTRNASSLIATEPALLVQQARAVLEDIPVACFKVGFQVALPQLTIPLTILLAFTLVSMRSLTTRCCQACGQSHCVGERHCSTSI